MRDLHYQAKAEPVLVPPVPVPASDTWFVPLDEPPRPPPRAAHLPFGTAQIDEADFEPVPPAPEHSWHAPFSEPVELYHRRPPVERFPFLQMVVPPALFGTVDYHPGHWWKDLESATPPPARKRRPEEMPFGELRVVDGLFAPPVKFDWYRPWEIAEVRGRRAEARNRCTQPDGSDGWVWWGPGGGDSLRFYFSGANADGGAQGSPDASLGNYRSSTEAERVGPRVLWGMRGVVLEFASRANGATTRMAGAAVGTLEAVDADHVRYTAPGSTTPGSPTRLDLGVSTGVADGADPAKWVRVRRTSALDLAGALVVEFLDQFHNVFGFGDAGEALSAAGGRRYRVPMARCESLASVRDIVCYIGTLGASAVSAGGGLPAAGAGTLSFTDANACADWPPVGMALIEQSNGTRREHVFYSSRTNSTLTVPAGGRARLGSVASAGLATDRVTPVPPIRIGWELAAPAYKGPVQSVANETTAPAGITWSTGIAAATGVNVGTLHTYQQGGIWIELETPAGAQAVAEILNLVKVQYRVDPGRTLTETLAGLSGIADTDLDRYELVVASGSPPALDAPATETFTSRPYTSTLALAVGTHYYRIRRRNQWNLAAEPIEAGVLRVISDGGGGVVVATKLPSDPRVLSWSAGLGGTFVLSALYEWFGDAPANATEWLLYARYDGTDPDPSVDVPTVVAMSLVQTVEPLTWSSPAQAAGATGKVIVRVRRSSDSASSVSTTVYTATASTSGPGGQEARLFYRNVAEQR